MCVFLQIDFCHCLWNVERQLKRTEQKVLSVPKQNVKHNRAVQVNGIRISMIYRFKYVFHICCFV